MESNVVLFYLEVSFNCYNKLLSYNLNCILFYLKQLFKRSMKQLVVKSLAVLSVIFYVGNKYMIIKERWGLRCPHPEFKLRSNI